ncbi:MAG TPA: ATP-binding protein [Longimicrobiales bacterium]|nr:ATP-binding protein [Longimicrobiales bacterium]
MHEGTGRDHRAFVARGEDVDWLDAIPAPAAVLSRQGEVLQFNSEAATLFGWAGEGSHRFSREGSRWFDRVVHAVDVNGGTTTVVTRRHGGRRQAIELRCRRVDDNRMLMLFRDCTAQVKARKVRRSGEHHLRSFLDRLPESVIVEQGGCIVYSNTAAAQLVGPTAPRQLRGAPTSTVLPADVLKRVRQVVRTRTPAAPGELEYAVRTESGERFLQAAALPMRFAGGPSVVLLLRDVTEHRRAEHGLAASNENLRRSEQQLRQAQKMDAIGRLAAGIAHDFNNLLTAIQGHVQFVLEDLPEDAPVREDVVEVRKVAERATELTRQLLTFARRQPNHPQAVDVNAVVADVERLLRRLVRADISLELALRTGIPEAMVDRGQLEQVLVNLAVNARDAIRDGGRITIRTSATRFDDSYGVRGLDVAPGEYVQLTISDNGCGMSEDVQSKMFEPFFTTRPEGTGLGLPTVYGIVRQCGGHISVYSEIGVGTTIKVFLPVASAGENEDVAEAVDAMSPEGERMPPAPVSAAASAPDRVGTNGQRPVTVLLVEDDDSIRRLAERTLRKEGLNVIAAASGEEALSRARDEKGIDVVVTDLMMPNMSGEELAERLSGSHPDARIVLMSGFTEEGLKADGRVSAQQRFLEKPFTQKDLVRTVRQALRDG